MEIRSLEVFDILKSSFRWITDIRIKKLFGAIFAAEVISFAILALILIGFGLLMFSETIFEMLNKFGQLTQFSILPMIVQLGVGIVIAIIASIILVVSGIYFLGWHKDKALMDLTKNLIKIRFVIDIFSFLLLLALIFVLLSIFKGPVMGLMQTLPAEMPDLSGLLQYIIEIPTILAIILIILLGLALFFVNLGWSYIIIFFLSAKVLEIDGIKTRFTEISFDGYLEYFKLLVVDIFTTLFNWVNKKMLAFQLIFLILGIILLISAFITTNPTFLFLIFLVVIPYFIAIVYNSFRFYILTPVRLAEAKNATESMKITWEHTRGYVIALIIISILIAVAVFVVNLIGSIISIIAEFLIGILPTVFLPVYVLEEIIVNAFLGVAYTFIILLAIIAVYMEIRRAEGLAVPTPPPSPPTTPTAPSRIRRPAIKQVEKPRVQKAKRPRIPRVKPEKSVKRLSRK